MDLRLRLGRRIATGAAIAAVTAVSCWLRMTSSLWLVLYNVDDDQLYVRLADSLRRGDWLGAFDSRTLEKPPGFSIFLRIAHTVPLPYVLTQHLLLVAAAGVCAVAVFRASAGLVPALIVYAVVVLDPTYTGAGASRLLRDNWYSSLSLLLLGLALLMLPSAATAWRPGVASGVRHALGGLIAGGCLFLYWLGRSERPWLFPALLLVVAGAVTFRAVMGLRAEPELRRRSALARACLLPGISVGASILVLGVGLTVVAEKNERTYGVRVTEDMYSGAFASFYGEWQSVQAGPARRYVPISRPQRLAVYEVSPAAARLRPALEDPSNIYLGFGCQVSGICDDFMAGWLPFALREATRAAGAFGNARAAHTLWNQIADDIRSACDDGRLRCSHPMPATLPSPSRVSVVAWWSSTWDAARYLGRMGQADPVRPSSGQPTVPDQRQQFDLFRSVVRGIPSSMEQLNREESAEMASWPERKFLVDLYSWLLRLGFPLAAIGLMAAVVVRPPGWVRTWWIAVSAGLAAAARVITVGFVDSTTFPASTSPSYMLPAASPLLLCTVLGISQLALVATHWRRRELVRLPRSSTRSEGDGLGI